MENENNKKNKIIITTSVIIIFALMIMTIVIFIINFNKNMSNNSNSLQEQNNLKNITNNEIEVENVTNEKIIEDSTKYINKRFGKIEIVWLDKQNNIISEPLTPALENMSAVKYVETSSKFITTNENDNSWYNYKNKKWANSLDKNGSYFVWIPRYAYKIVYYSDNTYTKEIGYSDARGILKINDDKTLTRITNNNTGLVEIGNHYILQPAFMKDTASGYKNGGWDDNLTGIWVAKYEMSMESNEAHINTNTAEIGNIILSSNVHAVSKPGVTSWRNIMIGNCYYNSYNYNRELESHLMKNSEWGAAVYLAYSKYGTNKSTITENKSQEYITGGSKIEEEIYNYNANQSTTGNSTGIYDLSGSAWEYISTFINNGYDRATAYGGTEESFLYENTKNTKYKTTYAYSQTDNGKGKYDSSYAKLNYQLNSGRRGDAIFETSTSAYGSDSWNTNTSFFMQQDVPFLIRGGDFGSGASAGLFSFNASNGQANAGEGYRVVLAM